MMKKIKFPFFSLLNLLIFTFCGTVNFQPVYAQAVIEAAETLRLYDKVGDQGRVPVVKCIDLAAGGRFLAAGGDDHIVRIWDTAARKFTAELREHRDWIRSLAFSPDRTKLVTVAQDGQIRIWNVSDGHLLHSFKQPVRGTQQIRFRPDGSQFAVCGFDQNIRIYDAGSYRLTATLPAHSTNNEAMDYSADGSLLAAGGRTGKVRLWRTADNKHLADTDGDSRRVRAVVFSPDGSLLAAGGDGPFITLWNPQNGKLIKPFAERPGKTCALAFCGNDTLASGESDNVIRIWNIAAGTQTAVLSGHTGTISAILYDSASQKLISSGFDASVRFWTLPARTATPALPAAAF
jgi:WD40 repeat protein